MQLSAITTRDSALTNLVAFRDDLLKADAALERFAADGSTTPAPSVPRAFVKLSSSASNASRDLAELKLPNTEYLVDRFEAYSRDLQLNSARLEQMGARGYVFDESWASTLDVAIDDARAAVAALMTS